MSFLLGLPIFRGYVKFLGCTGELVNYAIAEHIENAGVHSGDASLLLPAQRLFVETHRRVKSISQKLCHLDWYFHRENGGTLLMVP